MENMQLKVTGMTCGHCKTAVEEALKEVSGVSDVSVDLENGLAEIHGEVNLQDLIDAVVEEGYEAVLQTAA